MICKTIRIPAVLGLLFIGTYIVGIPSDVQAQGIAINVDETQRFQTIDGFGASLTDSSAWLITHVLKPVDSSALLRSLFDPKSGIGLSYLRQPMGSSDFRTRQYTYDDSPNGAPDYALKRFSVDLDREYIVPTLRQILSINPSLHLMGSPWSPPAWMKESVKDGVTTAGTVQGGRLRGDDRTYASLAGYFVRYVRAYRALGVPIDAVTLQNEPWNENGSYPTMRLEPADEARLAILVGKRFEAEQIKTKIVVWDHNWDHPEYPIAVLNNAEARPYIAGVAFHGYGGNVSAQSKVHDAFPDKSIYFTEVSGGNWATDFGSNLMWDTANLIVGATRNWARTVVKWNLALDEKNGPKLPGGADTCRGVVTIHRDTCAIVKEEEYYALGHASKFVMPGAVRIASDNTASVAFVNPDGSFALIAYNKDSAAKDLAVRWRGHVFHSNLPPVSVATFTWTADTTAPASWWLTSGDQKSLLEKQPDLHFE